MFDLLINFGTTILPLDHVGDYKIAVCGMYHRIVWCMGDISGENITSDYR
jgi:hypothetical protein